MTVGIIMGSKSDWPTMQHAADMLDKFGLDYETKVVSAHRTPQLLADYASSAADRGIKIIIAGANALVSGESPRAARQRLESFLEPKENTEYSI